MSDDVRETLAARGKTHGDWGKQAFLAQKLKLALLGEDFYKSNMTSQMQEGVEMICVKLSRIITGDPAEIDHWRDIAGYATLVADAIEGEGGKDVEEVARPPIPKVVS